MRRAALAGFDWADIHRQIARDRERIPQFASGQKPSTPNQYMLPDGRVFDAEQGHANATEVDQKGRQKIVEGREEMKQKKQGG